MVCWKFHLIDLCYYKGVGVVSCGIIKGGRGFIWNHKGVGVVSCGIIEGWRWFHAHIR